MLLCALELQDVHVSRCAQTVAWSPKYRIVPGAV
jgi:hypothetical protein